MIWTRTRPSPPRSDIVHFAVGRALLCSGAGESLLHLPLDSLGARGLLPGSHHTQGNQRSPSITTQTHSQNWVGLPGYLALWHLTALLTPAHCSALLAHLGYDYHTPALPSRPPPLLPTKDRRQEASSRHTSSKSVYSCLVVGPKDAGKTTFCQRFLGRGHEATADIPPEELPRSTVNSVTVYGQPKYLVLLDTDINTAADCLTPLQVRLQSCHVLKPGRLSGSLGPSSYCPDWL